MSVSIDLDGGENGGEEKKKEGGVEEAGLFVVTRSSRSIEVFVRRFNFSSPVPRDLGERGSSLCSIPIPSHRSTPRIRGIIALKKKKEDEAEEEEQEEEGKKKEATLAE